ncbi:uncharacterized protein LOC103575792 [Microplitis demolitor]|uniref:uncharacterized protein LOC103575792 n=1 Tax=Microplitis demolitor TaxID=69319 RepID=UPI0004400080|nr:uncharacterized protein LOC103575792 [Microplitis demolitor]XP_008553976.1 uncharacterized protein LOC103575792 [Microplitis demolitor]
MRILWLLIFWIAICQGQLNYEGNPLTENTEYTADETHYHVNYDRRKLNNTTDPHAPATIYFHDNKNTSNMSINVGLNNKAGEQSSKAPSNLHASSVGTLTHQVSSVNPSIKAHDSTSTMQIQSRQYSTDQSGNFNKMQATSRQIGSSSVISNDALSNFLNSRTPAESQYALDNYLQMTSSQVDTQVNPVNVDSTKYYQVLPSASSSSSMDINQQSSNGQVDNVSNLQSVTSMTTISDTQPEPQIYQTYPLYQPTLQSRHDYIPRMRRRPYYRNSISRYRQRIQPRLGHGYIGKGPGLGPPPIGLGPGPVGLGPGPGPVGLGPVATGPMGLGPIPYGSKPEVIYTKPPGASPGYAPGAPINNSPYEDASAHFSALNHPPPPKDNVYYSQLYAQSYDPHYYNYIAKTGKIKPWLYGKMGRHPEETSFWGELFQSFMKHGMKNMMNPMFLLGLSIPAITLMLSAIVPKRSFARSSNNYGDYLSEEKINELADKVRKAIKCYESNKFSDSSNCW